jgi:MFS family permease
MADVRSYAVVTATYWAFTVTDGALRMLILLYLHEQGYSPLSLAAVFILYELCGVLTNLIGGLIGSRFGLDKTLSLGLILQIAACTALATQASSLTVLFVMLAQAVSGIAKDLTKMSAKSYIKRVVPADASNQLLRWVTLLTGSKNTLKGAGFFVGGWLLSAFGFAGACVAMAATLSLTLTASIALLPRSSGRASGSARSPDIFSKDRRINWLAAARLVLFGSRDLWFAVALPIFLSASLGWSFSAVGAFLALWVIAYGIVQANAPRFTTRRSEGNRRPPSGGQLLWWTASLLIPLGGIVLALTEGAPTAPALVVGLGAFGVLFAANSAVHSYLIVAYADSDAVAMNVGFYYSANALGRLIGTVLSGFLFESFGMGTSGLTACLLGSVGFTILSSIACIGLKRAEDDLPVDASSSPPGATARP